MARRQHLTLGSMTPQRAKTRLAKQARPKAIGTSSDSDSTEHAHDDERGIDLDRDEQDSDAPRVAQWVDDEDLEPQAQTDSISDPEAGDSDDDGASEAGPSQRLRSLQDDLSTLPLGTLRSAQRSLAQALALDDTASDSEQHADAYLSISEDDTSFPHPPEPKDEQRRNERSISNKGPAKRTNKHAPIEITSKRPVSHRRLVVGDTLPKPRDPRFMHAFGRHDPSKFKQQYEFLSGLRRDELATLQEHVKRARKLLATSPSYLRAEREEEVSRLELATKRAESTVNLDNRERIEREALHSAKRTEKEKRKQGKAEWWMKRSAKKELLSKARLDAIASDGGKLAVKKAIEKKQRKLSQKEKKMRPFPQNQGAQGSDSKRRRPAGAADSERKLRKI